MKMDVLGLIKCLKNSFLLIHDLVHIHGCARMRQAGEPAVGPVTLYTGALWLSDRSFVFS